MLTGVGIDIIEIDRIRKSILRHGSHFIKKIFTQREQEYCSRYQDPVPRYAGKFAAKEAVVKALGTGFGAEVAWTDIEILHADTGAPYPLLSPSLRERFGAAHLLISITHSREYAAAVAFLTKA